MGVRDNSVCVVREWVLCNLEKILVLLCEDEYESYTHVFFPLLMDFLSPRLAPKRKQVYVKHDYQFGVSLILVLCAIV